jgi:3-methyladenine DNA glycosylase/8-oxoguanine DNA glycosylase
MDKRTSDQLSISLARKVRRRVCPKCRQGLEDSVVTVKVLIEAAQVGFICCGCGFQSEGIVQLSDRIKRELMTGRVPEPVSEAEVAAVRRSLANYHGPLTELFA